MRKLLTITFILFLLSNSSFSQVPVKGLVAWYPFSGNADDYVLNNNGIISGVSLATDRFGNANSAYYFNGTNNYITFPQLFPFNQTGDVSISIWIKSNTPTNGVQSTFLKSRLDVPDNNRFNFFLYPSSNSNQLVVNVDYRESDMNLHNLNISHINIGDWQNIILTRVGTNYKLYINGLFINTSTDNTPVIPTAVGWVLGVDPSSSASFNGTLDDIRIYNRALSSNEIDFIYNENICFKQVAVTDTLIIATLTTAINTGQETLNNITVYPNPTKDVLNIAVSNISTTYSININNSLGQSVYSSQLSASLLQVNLSSLGSKGMYIIQILDNTNNVTETKKLILE